MLKENLKDSGEILQNILTQPLSIPGAQKDVSLIEAAKSFNPEEAISSDLRNILLSFTHFPVPTMRLIEEMEIIRDDLFQT